MVTVRFDLIVHTLHLCFSQGKIFTKARVIDRKTNRNEKEKENLNESSTGFSSLCLKFCHTAARANGTGVRAL